MLIAIERLFQVLNTTIIRKKMNKRIGKKRGGAAKIQREGERKKR